MNKKIDAIKLKAEIDKYIEEMRRIYGGRGVMMTIVFESGIKALEMAKYIIDDMIIENETLSHEEE